MDITSHGGSLINSLYIYIYNGGGGKCLYFLSLLYLPFVIWRKQAGLWCCALVGGEVRS